MRVQKHLTSMALVLLALGAGVYAWVDRESVTEGERTARPGSIFAAWRREDVTRIELVRGNETLVLERALGSDSGDNAWHMTSPRKDEADAAAVDKLLQQLELANAVRKVEGAGPGIPSPRLRGSIVMGKLKYGFVLGDPAPTPEGAGYLRVENTASADDAHTFVVSRELVNELLKGAEAYRARTIVPYLSIDLAKLEVRGRKTGFAIERIDATSFRLQEGSLRASRERLDRVWRALAEMRAESFVSEADATKATETRSFTITMTPKDASRAKGELIVGAACPGQPDGVVVVRTSPTPLAACAPKGILEGLGTDRESLIDRRMFAAHDDEIAELLLEVSPSGASLDLARKGNGWHLRAPRDADLSGDEVNAANALATALARAEGEIVPNADAIRAHAVVRGRVTAGTELLEVLWLDPTTYVRRRADGAILRVSNEIARKLAPHMTTLRGRQVWSAPIEGKPVRSMTTRCHGTTQEITREGNGWALQITAPGVSPKLRFDADVPNVLELSEALARVRAEAWEADADDGSFGFASESCSAALTVVEEAGTRSVRLVFGSEGEGGTYARADGDPAVFVVPPRIAKLASTLFVDLHGFSADPAALSRLTVTRAGKLFLRTRKELPEALLIALAQLRADAAIHLGAPLPQEGFASPTLEFTTETSTDAARTSTRIVLGRATVVGGRDMYFARIDGVEATFVVAKERVAAFFDTQ